MILTPENTAKAGKPVVLFDANDVPIPGRPFWADTETGEVQGYPECQNGQVHFDNNGDLVKYRMVFKAPLIVKPQYGESK